jgi:hypothetical protein
MLEGVIPVDSLGQSLFALIQTVVVVLGFAAGILLAGSVIALAIRLVLLVAQVLLSVQLL